MGLLDSFTDALATDVSAALSEDAKARVAALFTTRAVAPDADVYDRCRLARFILTGNEDLPEFQPDEGYHVELGEHRFTQAQWEAILVYCAGTEAATASQVESFPRPLLVGDRISIEDHDGKGVSGYVTDWTTEDGGSRFTVYAGPERLKAQTEGEPDPAEIPELLPETEPAPTEGEGWAGRRG
jgi:hypothetical protein